MLAWTFVSESATAKVQKRGKDKGPRRIGIRVADYCMQQSRIQTLTPFTHMHLCILTLSLCFGSQLMRTVRLAQDSNSAHALLKLSSLACCVSHVTSTVIGRAITFAKSGAPVDVSHTRSSSHPIQDFVICSDCMLCNVRRSSSTSKPPGECNGGGGAHVSHFSVRARRSVCTCRDRNERKTSEIHKKLQS